GRGPCSGSRARSPSRASDDFAALAWSYPHMSTYVLIPGAGGAAKWYWRLVIAELEAAGHEAVAVDLPADDPAKGLPEYVDLVAAAAQDRRVVLVAQSLGAFTAFPACDRVDAERLI